MTDRELLELAAKAAGLKVIDAGGLGLRIESEGCKSGYMWNPLADDGDALRLAVKLKIRVRFSSDWTYCEEPTYKKYGSITTEELGTNDPYAATCRAIVRTAAEMHN